MTKYEAQILDIVNTSHTHMTAEEIFFKLREKEPKVVLATVYNNLNKLVEKEDIVKIILADQPERFDKKTKHDHLVCSVCKKITDYNFGDFKALFEKELGYKIQGYDLKVSYICPECMAKQRNNGI